MQKLKMSESFVEQVESLEEYFRDFIEKNHIPHKVVSVALSILAARLCSMQNNPEPSLSDLTQNMKNALDVILEERLKLL